MAEQLQQVVQAAFQAAQAAASAAKTMEETMNKRSGNNKFGEASKVIRMPDCFGTENDHDAEQSKWPEFSMGFKAWLYYAEKEYEKELTYVEDNVKTTQPLSSMNEDSKARSEQLYSILTGLLRGRPLKILRAVNERNGYEVWRQLVVQYSPKTKGRAISVLSAYMNFPAFDKSKTFLEHIQSLERVRTEYRKVAGVDIGDDLQLSVLIRCLPKYLQQHIQLQLTESSSYQNVRDAVLSYETVTQSWSEKKVLTELGVVGSTPSASGPAPMEIDAVQQFGGYGKGKKGKGKGKSDGKSFKGNTLTKEKEKERARTMARDRGQRLRNFKVIAISAGSLDIKRVTAVRRKVVESLTLVRRVLDRLKKLAQQMVYHHLVVTVQSR